MIEEGAGETGTHIVGSLVLFSPGLVGGSSIDVRLDEKRMSTVITQEERKETFFSSSDISFHFAPSNLPTSPKPASGFSALILSRQS